MLDSVDLIAEHKQKYYDSLRACFTEYESMVSFLEQRLAEYEGIDEEDLDEEDKKLIHQYILWLKINISHIRITYPLLKAWYIMSIEAIPLWIESKCEEFYKDGVCNKPRNGNFASRDDIYELLVGLYRPYQNQILGCIYCSPSVKDDLADALSSENKQEFCSILKEKCDYTVVAEWLFQTNLCLDGIKNIEEDVCSAKRAINGKYTTEDDERAEKNANWVRSLWHKYSGNNALIKHNIEQETYLNRIITDNKRDIDNDIKCINNEFVRIAYLYESNKDNFYPTEASILKPILESDEYKRLYQENKEKIDILVQGDDETGIETVAEERDDESSCTDVLQDVESPHTEPRFKFKYQYDSSFVSAAELQDKMRSGIHYKRGWKDTYIQRNSNNLYYKGAITYRPDTKDFPDEYDEVKWLYEKMVSLTAIEHTAENFNSFMFRMTGKRKDNQVIIRIPWLLTANELYFWIGHIIGDSKSRIPDGTFPLSKNVFFETVKDEIEFDKPTASKVNSLDSTWRGELIPKQMFEDINKFIPEMLSTRKKIE